LNLPTSPFCTCCVRVFHSKANLSSVGCWRPWRRTVITSLRRIAIFLLRSPRELSG
jgi:hypothetical protein